MHILKTTYILLHELFFFPDILCYFLINSFYYFECTVPVLYCTVGCEPIGELSTAAVLADLYDRELVLTISWAKQVIRRTYLSEQNRTCRPENYVELSYSNVSLSV